MKCGHCHVPVLLLLSSGVTWSEYVGNPSLFLLMFCSYCKALFVGHWICDFVHTVYFAFWFVSCQPFLFSFILILRQEDTPPLPAGWSLSPPHHWYFFSSLAPLTLSLTLFFRFDLLLWFLSLSHSLMSLISSLAQLLPPLWLSILASVWVATIWMICWLWLLSECLCLSYF